MIRLLLADDHNLFREGVKKLLENEKDIAVVGEAEDGIMLITKYNELKPDVILTDISMPGKNGPDAIKTIKKNNKKVGVLFLSQFTGDDYINMVLSVDGNGLLSKNILHPELTYAIRKVAEGENYFLGKSEKELTEIVEKFKIKQPQGKSVEYNQLTRKEKEVLLWIGKGKKSSDIAEQLNVSVRTIESHRASIISKMHLSSLPELLKFAMDYVRNKEE